MATHLNLFSAFAMFELQSKLSGKEWDDLKTQFHNLLENNQPTTAMKLVIDKSESLNKKVVK